MYDQRRTEAHPVRVTSARQPLDIRVLDGSYRVVLRGYGTAVGALPAGLYEIRTGWRSHEERRIVRVPPGGLDLAVTMALTCPTPLPGSEGFIDAYTDAVRQGCRLAEGLPAGLVTFVHGAGDLEASIGAMTVLDSQLRPVPARAERGDTWAMNVYATGPGGHVLRREDQGVDRSLWLTGGWTHLCFARVGGASLKPATSFAMLKTGATWLGGGDAECRLAQHGEQALAALYDGEITPEETLAAELKEASTFDPMIGLLGGCLSLLAMGRAEQGDPSRRKDLARDARNRLGALTDRLDDLLGWGHPDLFALRAAWAATGGATFDLGAAPVWPPMLADAFDVLVSLDIAGKWAMHEAGPLADAAAGRSAMAPWTQWSSVDAWSTSDASSATQAPSAQEPSRAQEPTRKDSLPKKGRVARMAAVAKMAEPEADAEPADEPAPAKASAGAGAPSEDAEDERGPREKLRREFAFGAGQVGELARRAQSPAARKVAQYIALELRMGGEESVGLQAREVAQTLGMPRSVARKALRELTFGPEGEPGTPKKS